MTHNVQKGGDFLKSYSANCNQVAFFPWTNRKKGQSPLNIYPRRKNSEQTVWMTFSFGGCLSFCKLFRNIWLESDRISEKVVLFFFFSGRNVLNGNFCFISKIASLSFKPWDWFVWIIGPNRERSVAHVNGKQIRSNQILSRKYNYERSRVQWIPTDEQTAWPYISCRLSVYINKSKFIL